MNWSFWGPALSKFGESLPKIGDAFQKVDEEKRKRNLLIRFVDQWRQDLLRLKTQQQQLPQNNGPNFQNPFSAFPKKPGLGEFDDPNNLRNII